MELLKKIWSTPFKVKSKDIVSLIVQLVIFLVICVVIGWVIGLLAKIPVLGVIFGLVGGLMEIYGLVGIVLCILKFFDKV